MRHLLKLCMLGVFLFLNADGRAQSFTVLKNFTSSDGAAPYDTLILSGNTLYGTTYLGGNSNFGTVFKMNTDGSGYTVLKHFAGTDGANPFGSLTLSGSTLFGATVSGGNFGGGTIFKVNTDGSGYTVLKHFSGSEGASPNGRLALSGSTLYGTAGYGGISDAGAVFEINTNGSGYTVLLYFDTGSGGATPDAGLTLSSSTLYGAAGFGGSWGSGTVYKMNTDGSGFTVLKDFSTTVSPQNTNSDGATPYADLTLLGSTLYGTTGYGGSSGSGTVFKVNTDGSRFTVLKHFSALLNTTNSDGATSWAGLALSGSTLYGTTVFGGSSGNGTVFKVNTDGSGFTVLKHFSALSNATNSGGANPYAGLVISGNSLYGTTSAGGISGYGVIYKISLSVAPFITLSNTSALSRTLNVTSAAGSTNRVWISTNLNLPFAQWQPYTTNIADANGLFQITDTNINGRPMKFYRVSTP